MIAYFCWGASYYYPVTGVYLVARHKLFSSFSGRLRAIGYASFAAYGYMSSHVVQDWLVGSANNLAIPGSRIEHYGAACMILCEILNSAWVFWPIIFLFHRRLSESAITKADILRPNVRFFLSWTAMAAVMLVSVRMLAEYGRPLNVAVAYQGTEAALRNSLIQLPLSLTHVLTVALFMVAVGRGLRHCLWAVPCVVLFRFVGEQAWFTVNGLLGDPRQFGVMSGPLHESMPHFAGSTLMWCTIAVVCQWTGLSFRRVERHDARLPIPDRPRC